MEDPHEIGVKGDLRNFSTAVYPETIPYILNKILEAPARDSISNQIAATEIYEIAMGIQTNSGNESPITYSTNKLWRDYITDSEWERTLRVLIKLKLHNATGLNIFQLLDLPRHTLRDIIKAAVLVARDEPNIITDIDKDIKKSMKNIDPSQLLP